MTSFTPLSGVLLLLSTSALAAQVSEADFGGTWELVSIQVLDESGDWVPWPNPMGGRAVGVLMYDGVRNMSAQITSDPRSVVTPPDWRDIIYGYMAYYGRYEVDAVEHTVTHHRRNHINPDRGNDSVVRRFELDGDRLSLTVVPDLDVRLTWVRDR